MSYFTFLQPLVPCLAPTRCLHNVKSKRAVLTDVLFCFTITEPPKKRKENSNKSKNQFLKDTCIIIPFSTKLKYRMIFCPKSSTISFPLRVTQAFLDSSIVLYLTNEQGLLGGIKRASTCPNFSKTGNSWFLLTPLPKPPLATTRILKKQQQQKKHKQLISTCLFLKILK